MAAKRQTNQEIKDYVASLDAEQREEVIEYELIGGNTGSLPRNMIVIHLAMHGTFHRGFIGDMFGQIPWCRRARKSRCGDGRFGPVEPHPATRRFRSYEPL